MAVCSYVRVVDNLDILDPRTACTLHLIVILLGGITVSFGEERGAFSALKYSKTKTGGKKKHSTQADVSERPWENHGTFLVVGCGRFSRRVTG